VHPGKGLVKVIPGERLAFDPPEIAAKALNMSRSPAAVPVREQYGGEQP